MSDCKVQMDSDEFLNNPEKVKRIEEWSDVQPVDLNRGFVPTKKFDKGNLKETEENISDRFGL